MTSKTSTFTMDRFRTQSDSLSYYASDYAVTPAIPLLYWDDARNLSGRPVPLIDLFPVFASASPLVNNSTPIPIVELCRATSSLSFANAAAGPNDAVTALSICLLDKCRDTLSAASRTEATGDMLLSAADRIWRDGGAAHERAALVQHFNSYNTLEECAIRQCPLDYFISHSSYCVSLSHPFFVQRKIFLPSVPAQYTGALPASSTFPNGQDRPETIWADYLTQVGRPNAGERIGSNKDADVGIRLPALPAGFPCDHRRIDQTLGTLLSIADDYWTLEEGRSWSRREVSSSGTWFTSEMITTSGPDPYLLAKVHTWVMKSTLFRGLKGLGYVSVEDGLRDTFGTVPANVYSLGHCPEGTGVFTGSKLSGEACTSSLECVFSLCVGGKCAEAAMGKKLTPEHALAFVGINPRFWEEHLARKHRGAIVLWAVVGVICGLVALRIVQLQFRRKRAMEAREERDHVEPRSVLVAA